ncbi:retrovirus-related Pol polyprotein from transposon TNT 1-94 [Sesbania bispinosa]|nr:retrovirus-related Pol polyprotein from transposon TNT 1-94 [Sesbania bispinosa]
MKNGHEPTQPQQWTSEGVSLFVTEADKKGTCWLTVDQWQMLAKMLNKADFSEKMMGKTSWIIDTGASNHMTSNLKELHDVHDIVPCPVGLPDGDRTNATKEGTIFLEGGLKLANVLYVPKLNCSLLSVSHYQMSQIVLYN